MTKTPAHKLDFGRIRRGIAAYDYEQRLLLRLVRRYGAFTERDFDRWFLRKNALVPIGNITGDTFLLGVGINGGTRWAVVLEVLQAMVMLGDVDTKRAGGLVVYCINCGAPRR